MLEIFDVKCERYPFTIALPVRNPQFSWKLKSENQNVIQTSYQITVYSDGKIIWDSKKVNSTNSTGILYEGEPLENDSYYEYQIKIEDNHHESCISEMKTIRTSHYEEKWDAKWITGEGTNPENGSRAVEVFKKEMTADKRVKSAFVMISALGLYTLYINDIRVGNDYFTPGYNPYRKYTQYQTYEITDLLKEGTNKLHVFLANGWYCGRFAGKNNFYGNRTALILQISIKYEDGSEQTEVSDSAWEYTTEGPVLFSEFYDGEIYDANKKELEKLNFFPVREDENIKTRLVPHFGTTVNPQEERKPAAIVKSTENSIIYDFGQNFSGWIKITHRAEKGRVITVTHAEVLDRENELYTANLRSAKASLTYICGTDETESYEPHFTYMGFRYAMVQGLKPSEIIDVTGVVVYSTMDTIGSFYCSDEKVNRLQKNISWSEKSNFLEIPTDCPQRDERLGWTGDLAVFANTAVFNMDASIFLKKWLTDLRIEQAEDGAIPLTVPDSNINNTAKIAVAGWGDAAVLVPYAHFLAYGDRTLLEEQYESMKKWVEKEKRDSCLKTNEKKTGKYLWTTGFQYGDWLAPGEKAAQWKEKGKYLATAYFANSTNILSKVALILGKEKDHNKYSKLFNDIKKAFCEAFLENDGSMKGDFQSLYVCALYFGLLPDESILKAAKNLVKKINENDGCLSTGFLGTPYITFALSESNQLSDAYKLLLNEKNPSWLYPVNRGATTIWERWDALLENGQVHEEGNMVSFNHYAYGAVGDWLYKVVAGLKPDFENGGYRHFTIEPRPGGEITYCQLTQKSPYGEIRVFWEIKGDTFHLKVTIPCNSSARIILPDKSVIEKGSGTYEFNI